MAFPTDTERLLYEAKARDDWEAELAVLSRTRLYLLVSRLHADTPGFVAPLRPQRDPATGRQCVAVTTPGLLPPWHPDWVFQQTTLAELAERWPNDKWWLGINQGTPYATAVEARPLHREFWQELTEETGGVPNGQLLTDAMGPLHGPLAHGLALGAHLAVHNSLVWNRLGAAYFDYAGDIESLRRPWYVTNRAEFREKLADLMAAKLVGRTEEFALHARRNLGRRLGRAASAEEWESTVTQALTLRRATEAEVKEAAEAVRRIDRYEQRFRADGILAPDRRVDTLAAFDFGRAVNVVRLALGARFCDPQEAEQAVLRIGEVARQAYGSWEEFSLGYALTRALHYDEDESGTKYQESVAAHRILAQDPSSPYRNIPWS
ncbi:DUF1266 domain-containing protein [Streptomyces sp. SYSU K21746]